jgi:hypothetical protein
MEHELTLSYLQVFQVHLRSKAMLYPMDIRWTCGHISAPYKRTQITFVVSSLDLLPHILPNLQAYFVIMSGTRAKLRGALTQVAQQVGIPVNGFVQDFNNLMDTLKVSSWRTRGGLRLRSHANIRFLVQSPRRIADLCEEMVVYIEGIKRSVGTIDNEEFKDELDELFL